MPDWDLEWLVTLPVSLATLLGVRIVDAPADRMGPELLNAYLELKRRELI